MNMKGLSDSLLSTECRNKYTAGVVAREVKMLDQYDPKYWELIESYQTTASICGFMVCAMGPYAAVTFKAEMTSKEVNAILDKLYKGDYEAMTRVSDAMGLIQSQRSQYMSENKRYFGTPKLEKSYLTDWVANYEISDSLKITSSDLENLFFLRFCGLDFPDLASKVKHEEKKRIKEEEPFRGQRVFIEVFYPERKLMSVKDFYEQRRDLSIFDCNKPMVFVGDLLGHYLTFIALKIKLQDGGMQDTVLLLDSTENNYLESDRGTEITKIVAGLAFPEGIQNGAL